MTAVAMPKPKREMVATATRKHADVLVLGHSLAAAIAATRLVKDGWTVLWPGTPPPAFEKLGEYSVPVAPGLSPSLANVPNLLKSLVNLGVDVEAKKLWKPVTLQLLDDARRTGVPGDSLKALSEDVVEIEPLDLGYFGRRRALARRATRATVEAPSGLGGEVARAIDRVLCDRDDDLSTALELASAPHDVAGGALALVSMLHKRYVDLGGWHHAGGFDKPMEIMRVGVRDVGGVLADGHTQSARLVVTGLDEADKARVLPEGDRDLAPKLAVEARPLGRLSFVVRSRGLPAPLGPVAFVDGRILVERRALAPGVEAVSAFHREDDSGRVLARLRAMLPFFERHVVARSEATRVPGHERLAADRLVRPRWRALQAMLPLLDASGLDGAGRLGEAVAARAKRLAKRKDLLK